MLGSFAFGLGAKFMIMISLADFLSASNADFLAAQVAPAASSDSFREIGARKAKVAKNRRQKSVETLR